MMKMGRGGPDCGIASEGRVCWGSDGPGGQHAALIVPGKHKKLRMCVKWKFGNSMDHM